MEEQLARAVDEAGLEYDRSYREEILLRDGQRVRLRAVQPSDKERLQEGVRRLSADASMARFFAVKRRFTREELAYLTELDGINHYALGAVLLDDEGREVEGIGVGRFVRDPGNPASAEPAVVVLDPWQGMGLGAAIFDRLVGAARERGIRYFHAEFLPGNDGILRLLEGICPELMVWRRGEVLVADVPLPDGRQTPEAECSRNALAALLRMAAQKLIRVRSAAREAADAEAEPPPAGEA